MARHYIVPRGRDHVDAPVVTTAMRGAFEATQEETTEEIRPFRPWRYHGFKRQGLHLQCSIQRAADANEFVQRDAKESVWNSAMESTFRQNGADKRPVGTPCC